MLLAAVVLLALLLPSPPAAGDSCEEAAIRPVYTVDRFGARLSIRICRDLRSLSFDAYTTRWDGKEGVGGNAFGHAPCADGVCRIHAGSIVHGEERATYRVQVWWGNGVYADTGALRCRTVRDTAGCRPAA